MSLIEANSDENLDFAFSDISSSSSPNLDCSFDAATDVASSKSLAEQEFDEYLIAAIDEALTSLGEPVKNTLYQQLEAFNIEKKNIPDKMDDFLYILHKIFGLGGNRLELKFTLNLQSKVKTATVYSEADLTLPKWIANEMSFKACVNELRKSLDLAEKL
jgi:hypothetical protein